MRRPGSRGSQKIRALFPKVSRIKRRECLAFDVETAVSSTVVRKLKKGDAIDYEQQSFMCGSVFVGDSSYMFWDKKKMAEFIMQPKYKKYWKVATNLYFDCSMLFDKIEEFEVCDWKFGRYKGHKFCDSLAYAPLSVKSQGDMIKLPKLQQPAAFLRFPADDEERAEIERYCERDAEITGRFFYWFQDMVNALGGEIKETAAQCSLDIFKRKYLKIKIYGEDDERQAIVRQSYKGGRVECFKRGVFTDVFYYDVNSLYPYIMSQIALPDPSSSHLIKRPSISRISAYEGVSEAELIAPKMHIPLLWSRSDGGKLVFPCGRFSGTYTHYELREAMKLGYEVTNVKRQIIYTRCFDDYKMFMKDLYAKRLECKKRGEEIEFVIKLMMNSSYGKLGQDNSKMTRCMHISKVKDISKVKSWVGKPDYENGWAVISDPKATPAFVHVIIASYVTAAARVHMHKLMREADPIYTDTDSIITQNEMHTSYDLGALKLEQTAAEALIIRPKVYMLKAQKTSVKCKGFPKITEESFMSLIAGGSHSYRKLSRFKESIMREVAFNSSYTMNKSLNVEDDKRVWSKAFSMAPQESEPIFIS